MKAVSIRLKAVVCELAMLPEIFSSAKDCARIPVTAVVRAPKIPMTSSPTAFGPSGRTRKESRNAARDGASAAPQDECEIDQSLKRKGPPAKDGPFLLLPAVPGRICRTSDARVFLRPLPVAKRGREELRRPGSRGGREFQRHAVHAIAQARRLRSIVKDVAEMAAAAAAMHFGAGHQKGLVHRRADRVWQRLPETRPAGAAFEFRLGGE